MENYATENYTISFSDEKKEIFMQDLTDVYNHTSAYNLNKRGYSKFKNQIISAVEAGDKSKFNTWVNVASDVFKLKMRTYCAMD